MAVVGGPDLGLGGLRRLAVVGRGPGCFGGGAGCRLGRSSTGVVCSGDGGPPLILAGGRRPWPTECPSQAGEAVDN
ncbi:hypothetical protein BRADI_4g00630v3 [Brachypodium distachyon]|uniref:Uncharacterized protein n=1 Tax=Brachypodium distachyon TaxID=15368 RepID=I1IG32_BRADI|nr:hypothetical protein BRADI_4g00630v3 [Brachypodium distachyon]